MIEQDHLHELTITNSIQNKYYSENHAQLFLNSFFVIKFIFLKRN
jgi:hypothetical protein